MKLISNLKYEAMLDLVSGQKKIIAEKEAEIKRQKEVPGGDVGCVMVYVQTVYYILKMIIVGLKKMLKKLAIIM